MDKITMPNEQMLECYSKLYIQEVQRCFDNVNASVAQLTNEEYILESSSAQCCNTLKDICKEYRDFILWKNHMKRTIPMEFLFLWQK